MIEGDPVTVDNWGYPPYNRRGFQQVQALFPTIRIRRGPGPVAALPASPMDLGDLAYTAPDGSQRRLRDMLDATFTDAFLVSRQGVVLWEEYRNGMAPDSHHLLNSVTKSFMGLLAGILAGAGVLDPERRVRDYLPELAGTAFEATRIRHLLDMTAAVRFGEDYADPGADFWRETAVVGWRPALVTPQTPRTLLEHARSLTAVSQRDGEKFDYRTVLTNVLGMAMERAAGEPLAKVFQERLWAPLGPEQDAAIVVDRQGFPYVGAGMNACARDLARFGQLVLQRGRLGGRQIVPEAWIEDIRRGDAAAKALFAASDYGGEAQHGHYRNQFWVFDSGQGVLVAIGIHGQTVYTHRERGVVIVKLSSHPQSEDTALFGDTFAAMAALAEAL